METMGDVMMASDLTPGGTSVMQGLYSRRWEESAASPAHIRRGRMVAGWPEKQYRVRATVAKALIHLATLLSPVQQEAQTA